MSVDAQNRAIWREARSVDEYDLLSGLTPTEESILGRLVSEISGQSILDIGVGTGRTTPFLAAITQDYTGIDYSSEMIAKCRSKFPGVTFIECDARDLLVLGRKLFKFVFFSYNGIDYASHEDRSVILHQIFDVLAPNGIFVFSSHNLDSHVVSAFSYKHIHLSLDPLLMAKRIYWYLAGIRNHSRWRRSEVRTKEYAILNDSAFNYRTLTYYASKKYQVAVLRAMGFSEIDLFDDTASQTSPEVHDADPWIHYIARKPAHKV